MTAMGLPSSSTSTAALCQTPPNMGGDPIGPLRCLINAWTSKTVVLNRNETVGASGDGAGMVQYMETEEDNVHGGGDTEQVY